MQSTHRLKTADYAFGSIRPTGFQAKKEAALEKD
jgi:hypothetical protein